MRSSYLSNPTAADLRAKISETHEQLQEEKRMHHASCLVQQGVWTHWNDVRPFDLSWRNLIYGPGPRVIAFVLNAHINSVRTPDMPKLWKKIALLPPTVHSPPPLGELQVYPKPRSLQEA